MPGQVHTLSCCHVKDEGVNLRGGLSAAEVQEAASPLSPGTRSCGEPAVRTLASPSPRLEGQLRDLSPPRHRQCASVACSARDEDPGTGPNTILMLWVWVAAEAAVAEQGGGSTRRPSDRGEQGRVAIAAFSTLVRLN